MLISISHTDPSSNVILEKDVGAGENEIDAAEEEESICQVFQAREANKSCSRHAPLFSHFEPATEGLARQETIKRLIGCGTKNMVQPHYRAIAINYSR